MSPGDQVTAQQEGEQARSITPRGARIPQVPIEETLKIVSALSQLAAPSSPQRIAQQVGTPPTSSRFKERLAAASYYGFVQRSKDGIEVTDRGEAVIGSDASAELKARREAVMSTNFGSIAHRLRGREANEQIIAVRLQDDYKVPESSAKRVANVMVTALQQAQLLSDGRFDTGPIEDLEGLLPLADKPSSRHPKAKQPEPKKVVAKEPTKGARERIHQSAAEKGTSGDQAPPFRQKDPLDRSSGFQVLVRIDATNLSPEQIVQLVKELRTLEQAD